MQQPVGYVLVHGKAEMKSFGAVLTNPQLWVEFPHTELAALATGSFVLMGVSAYYLARRQHVSVFSTPFRVAAVIAAISSVLVIIIGSNQAQHLLVAQPMKLAAAEALWYTSPIHAPWPVVAIFNPVTRHTYWELTIPYLLSILAYNRFSGRVTGITELQRLYVHQYGAGNYVPPVLVTFWSFRLMILIGFLMAIAAIWGVLLIHRRVLLDRPRYLRLMVWVTGLPVIGNIMGWVMTEVGRQPWIVFGLQKTIQGVSPTVTAADVITTLSVFTVVYGVVAVIAGRLWLNTIRQGPTADPDAEAQVASAPPTLVTPSPGAPSSSV
jgi:cytochrome d ubiquinol oxidase subunit I